MSNNTQVSLVIIKAEQFIKFIEMVEAAFELFPVAFQSWLTTHILENPMNSQFWLKQLRDIYAQVRFKHYS